MLNKKKLVLIFKKQKKSYFTKFKNNHGFTIWHKSSMILKYFAKEKREAKRYSNIHKNIIIITLKQNILIRQVTINM